MATTKKAAPTKATSTGGFSDAEKAAMKERAKELKAEAKRGDRRAKGEADLLAKVKEMPKPDRDLATTIHQIVSDVAPQLYPKTWYGMPAYANEEGKVVVFFKDAAKFDSRYATLGFEEASQLDDGEMWSTSYALLKITPAIDKQIRKLVKQAAGSA